MPSSINGIASSTIHAKIKLLISALTSITDTTGEFLLHLPDGRVIDTKSWHSGSSWEWTHGVGLYGIWQYYALTGDPQYLALIEDWFTERFVAGSPTKNINTMAVFLTLAYVYEHTGKEVYRPWLDVWGEWAYHDLPRTSAGGMQHVTFLGPNTEQLWDDTLMMTVLPLAKIGMVLNRPHYVEEAKRQFLIHIQYLFDSGSGCWFHGWQFTDNEENGRQGHNFAKALWARGNSWITIVIPEFLELLQEHDVALSRTSDLALDPIASHLLSTFKAQVAGLRRWQTGSGLWHTLLDENDSTGSYEEASASAGFAYGMLKAARRHYIDPQYDPIELASHDAAIVDKTACKAVKALLENISEDGELLKTSFGTGMGDSLQFYRDIKQTSMPYGQAMAIMALVEWARVYL
jgi:unsaturated rhamnogalacturonyl hydrolase